MIHERIDSDIDFSKKGATTWKELEKSDALSEFLRTHCKLGTYKMTVMKCADPQCKYHRRRRLSDKEWEDLHPFPDAELATNGTKVPISIA